jgi:hypothetical protein
MVWLRAINKEVFSGGMLILSPAMFLGSKERGTRREKNLRCGAVLFYHGIEREEDL